MDYGWELSIVSVQLGPLYCSSPTDLDLNYLQLVQRWTTYPQLVQSDPTNCSW